MSQNPHRQLLSNCSAMCSDRPKDTFSTRNLEQDLGQLVKGQNIERYREVLERPLASSAIAGENQTTHAVNMQSMRSLP